MHSVLQLGGMNGPSVYTKTQAAATHRSQDWCLLVCVCVCVLSSFKTLWGKMGFLLVSPFSYLFLTSFFLNSTDISINTTVWTIKDGQLALTSSLPLLPSQCLLQRLMVRDHVRMNTCARGCVRISKSYQCSPSLSSETFLRVFPAQDRQAVWPTQLDTRYILPGVCERPKT